MNPWAETGAAILLAGCAIAIALLVARLPRWCWISAYLLSLAIVVLFAIERFGIGLEFVPPFSWVAAGRNRYLLAAFITPILILTPAAQLPGRRAKILLHVLNVVVLAGGAVAPFLMAALAQKSLAAVTTKIDPDGVCLQQTDYTCGPAAAVTALRKLGLPANEGQIAIWSQSSKYVGTEPDVLAQALRSHFGSYGLDARFRCFENVTNLKTAGLTLAVVKYDFMEDHFVTVLGVSDRDITVGDPLNGKTVYPCDEFVKRWRFTGISITMDPARRR